MLLEKAYTKLLGGYELLSEINFNEILNHFSPGLVDKKSTHAELTSLYNKPDVLYFQIKNYLNSRILIHACYYTGKNLELSQKMREDISNVTQASQQVLKRNSSTVTETESIFSNMSGKSTDHDKNYGLLENSFYIVTGMRKIMYNKKINSLIRLKFLNFDWKRKEPETNSQSVDFGLWTGKFGPLDPIWDKLSVSSQTKNNEFWMPFEKFIKYFKEILLDFTYFRKS